MASFSRQRMWALITNLILFREEKRGFRYLGIEFEKEVSSLLEQMVVDLFVKYLQFEGLV